MGWDRVGSAPQDPAKLPAYVNEQLESLSRALEESYRPIFHITAERGGLLVAGAFEWAYGNGQSHAIDEGVIMAFPCALFALSLCLNGAAARAKIDVARAGSVEALYTLDLTTSNKGFIEFPVPLEYFPGDNFAFRTVTQSGTSGNNVVAAWFRTR